MSEAPKPPISVALFVTCLSDQFYPRTAVAVTKILEHFGCKVSFPEAQTCCGQPFFNNGFEEEARALARRQVRIFEPFPYIVTPSGSCCAMVRTHFGPLLKGDPKWAGRAAKVAERTLEFMEFLDRVLHVDFSRLALPAQQAVTYHYTCHSRALGGRDVCQESLGRIGNVCLTPMQRQEQCCGFGGTFAVKFPAISGAIVEDKANCIAETGAKTVICNDAGCAMNIGGMCHRRGMDVKIRHIADLLAEAMGIDLSGW